MPDRFPFGCLRERKHGIRKIFSEAYCIPAKSVVGFVTYTQSRMALQGVTNSLPNWFRGRTMVGRVWARLAATGVVCDRPARRWVPAFELIIVM
jgi:hypothetical protein